MNGKCVKKAKFDVVFNHVIQKYDIFDVVSNHVI
jgi:hypothetical protein